jgi:hypothetical protein
MPFAGLRDLDATPAEGKDLLREREETPGILCTAAEGDVRCRGAMVVSLVCHLGRFRLA